MSDAALLVASLIRLAEAQVSEPGGVPALEWMKSLNAEATRAVLAGDVFVSALSTAEGGSSSHLRGITAVDLLELTEVCLQQMEAEEEAGEGGVPGVGSVTYTTHGYRPAMF